MHLRPADKLIAHGIFLKVAWHRWLATEMLHLFSPFHGNTHTVVKAEAVDPNNVSDILFPQVVDLGKFGSAQSKLPRRFLLELGAESKLTPCTFYCIKLNRGGNAYRHSQMFNVLDNYLSAVNVIFKNLDQFLPRDGLRCILNIAPLVTYL